MSEPLVSIVIPVYNGENYLREAIDSALAQTYPNVEIIVVNDGSCDGGATERIALSYGDKIRYYYKENGGVASALNLGIQKMQGEYFSWLSHDDMYYSDKIACQIKALREYGNMTAIVHSDYDLCEVNSQKITPIRQSTRYPLHLLTNSVFPILQGLVHGCSLLIHKSHFDRVGVFDESLRTTQDYDLWFRMFRCQETVFINHPLVLTRLHKEQGSRTMACHDSERAELYIDFLKALTEDEMSSMYGSPYNFYFRMCCYFSKEKIAESYRFTYQKLINANIPETLTEQLNHLHRYVQELSGGKASRICIFCTGQYGMQLYQEFHCKLIPVDCFSDNNQEKWGSHFQNTCCIPPQYLEEKIENKLVIVANRSPAGIVNQLRAQGFPYVTTKQEIDRILFDTPPAISALKDIPRIIGIC